MEHAQHVLVITTTETEEAAHRLATSCVDARLGACSQIVGPISSVYRWKGSLETAQEWRVETKTTAERIESLRSHIVTHHDYDLPEVVVVPIIGGSNEYLSWVDDEVG
ncbi:MAG TPA: divalent-cation tolerance protein CutA [Acidimicrobiales bacterium]|nr:divalent-cation tolerance protein CutA [Acidimicrobiales bacterium]